MTNRLTRDFFNRDADVVAKELLGKKLVIKACGGCNFEWKIIETEAYKEEENRYGEEICHTDERMKSSGFIFAEGNNGLIITCGSGKSCDNVLIRGLIGAFYSEPFKAMHAFCMDGYLGNKRDCRLIDLTTPCDLTNIESFVFVEKAEDNRIGSFISSKRVGINSNNLWNFKLDNLIH